MHTRSKSNHHFVVSPAEAAELKRQKELGDYLCSQIHSKHSPSFRMSARDMKALIEGGYKYFDNTHRDPIADAVASINKLSALLKTMTRSNARGDDDDRRQMIADLISDDRSPFTPDDEEALRFMSDKVLKEIRGTYLKANSHTPLWLTGKTHRLRR